MLTQDHNPSAGASANFSTETHKPLYPYPCDACGKGHTSKVTRKACVLDKAGVKESGAWEAIVPLTASAPDFPVHALPIRLQYMVKAVAEATQTPLAMGCMLSIALASAAIAKTVEVQVMDGYREPLNIWAVVALPPASMKSAVYSYMSAPIVDFEKERAREQAPAIENARTERRILEKRLEKAEREAVNAKDEAARRSLGDEAKALAVQLAQADELTVPRFWADNATPEALSVLMAQNGGRIAIASPEGDVFGMMAGRYSQDGAPDIDVYLKGHAGDDVRVDRKKSAPVTVTRPALTMALTTQPGVIAGLQAKPGFRERGLLARCLFAMPQSNLGRRDVNPPSVPVAVAKDYRDMIVSLLKETPNTDANGEPAPHVITLSPGAHSTFIAFRERLEPRLGEYGDLGAVADWAGKLHGAVVRIAGVLHMVTFAGQPLSTVVSEQTMDRAIEIGETFLLPHAIAAFSLMGADPVVTAAQEVLAFIRRDGSAKFREAGAYIFKATGRDSAQQGGLRGRFQKAEEIVPALDELVSKKYLRRAGDGPALVYEVNPLVFAA